MNNFFERFFSVDELRISSLVVSLLLLILCAIYFLFKTGNIPSNLVTLLEYVIAGVVGINIGNSLFSNMSNKNNNYNSNKVYNNSNLNNNMNGQYNDNNDNKSTI